MISASASKSMLNDLTSGSVSNRSHYSMLESGRSNRELKREPMNWPAPTDCEMAFTDRATRPEPAASTCFIP